MANPYHHSCSSVRKWGGTVEEYLPIHEWFDQSKEHHGDFRHRALRHHTQGIFECERVFGHTITISTGRVIPVRWIGEQHVIEDMGFIPSVSDWFKHIQPQPWMNKPQPITRQIEAEQKAEREAEQADKKTNRQYVDALSSFQIQEHFTADEWHNMVQAAEDAYNAGRTPSPELDDEFVRNRLWNLLENNKKGRLFRDSDVAEQTTITAE